LNFGPPISFLFIDDEREFVPKQERGHYLNKNKDFIKIDEKWK